MEFIIHFSNELERECKNSPVELFLSDNTIKSHPKFMSGISHIDYFLITEEHETICCGVSFNPVIDGKYLINFYGGLRINNDMLKDFIERLRISHSKNITSMLL